MSGPYSAKDVAQYIVSHRAKQNDTLTPLQLMKIVYLCHGWMLGRYGRPLVKDAFLAWRYGPVAENLYAATKRFGSDPVTSVAGANEIQLDDEAAEVVDKVSDFYAKYDGISLSSLTHAPGSPWAKIMEVAGRDEAIPNDLIENFYRNLASTPAVAA